MTILEKPLYSFSSPSIRFDRKLFFAASQSEKKVIFFQALEREPGKKMNNLTSTVFLGRLVVAPFNKNPRLQNILFFRFRLQSHHCHLYTQIHGKPDTLLDQENLVQKGKKLPKLPGRLINGNRFPSSYKGRLMPRY